MSEKNWFAQQFEAFENDPEYKAGLLRLEFYENILSIMAEKNISRAELASRLGCSKAYITKLFSDSTNVTIQTMVKISLALGCELNIAMIPKEISEAAFHKLNANETYWKEYVKAKDSSFYPYSTAA
ncbi:MAG TPA: helix-turn-helix transcriptional regulator [Bacteroidota bacterium]|nr:helix-turn-helix transcriptional regulator [Bacteroidota bacterium]